MRPYWALFRARARTLAQYRVAALAGIATQWVFGLVMVSVLIAFYSYTDKVQPMTLAQAVTHTWLGQAMLGMQPWGIDRETGQSVRTGAVAYDLTRPLNLYAHWYVRVLALRTVNTALRALPMFAIAMLLLPAPYTMATPTWGGLGAWALATFGALQLSCATTLLMQASLFWTVTGEGVTRLMPHFITLLSGMVIPLPLFPDWMQTFLTLQPFYGSMNGPSMLFCSVYAPSEVWWIFGLQAFWTAVFVLLGQMMVHRGTDRLTVAGG